MSLIQALVLGLVQGVTEFLPISSSGHLILVPRLLGWQDHGLLFDVVVHGGTLSAVLWYYRDIIHRILASLRAGGNREDQRLAALLLVSMIPAGIAGIIAGDIIERSLRSPLLVAIDLIVWGIVLGIADRRNARATTLRVLPSFGDAVRMGFAQVLALLPGTSRSGITMTAGLLTGLSRQSAAEFSFLMSIPIIAAAGVSQAVKVVQNGSAAFSFAPLAVGFVAAMLGGIAAIALLLRVIRSAHFTPFVVYRIALGVLIVGMFL